MIIQLLLLFYSPFAIADTIEIQNFYSANSQFLYAVHDHTVELYDFKGKEIANATTDDFSEIIYLNTDSPLNIIALTDNNKIILFDVNLNRIKQIELNSQLFPSPEACCFFGNNIAIYDSFDNSIKLLNPLNETIQSERKLNLPSGKCNTMKSTGHYLFLSVGDKSIILDQNMNITKKTDFPISDVCKKGNEYLLISGNLIINTDSELNRKTTTAIETKEKIKFAGCDKLIIYDKRKIIITNNR